MGPAWISPEPLPYSHDDVLYVCLFLSGEQWWLFLTQARGRGSVFEVLFGLGETPLSHPHSQGLLKIQPLQAGILSPPALGMLPGSQHDHFPKLLTTSV